MSDSSEFESKWLAVHGPQPANWGQWSLMLTCTFWEAAWLIFDKEPKEAGWKEWLEQKVRPYGFNREFSDRLNVLLNRFGATLFDLVELPVLAAFCLSCGWSIPDELKALARPPEPAIDSDVTAPLATERVWSLKPIPERLPGYRWPLYQFLLTAHTAGKPLPKARDFLEWLKNNPNPEFEVMPDGLKYNDGPGNPKEANLKAIQQAIRGLLE